ncbi:hypothetical protein ASPWEDRAFT_243775 [Aspergillus wentii DTO 134E9]|uniref:Uncharacterized protein n=1 Tax=Aspergillus wentii DTO 134E9 TaxID=1073089 RepID=A0A1L9S1P3_ASPWE|nr:uncharacterized protein ASPWEDRAFT_243775 [Aspergillus wentii DTO 134E9]OJJ41080.1 hypothetical protein ASPWEDRAFT_243775 [Aspergillus wentii DTO 134E9]
MMGQMGEQTETQRTMPYQSTVKHANERDTYIGSSPSTPSNRIAQYLSSHQWHLYHLLITTPKYPGYLRIPGQDTYSTSLQIFLQTPITQNRNPTIQSARIAQLVERMTSNHEVRGSNPRVSTSFPPARIAQLVERMTSNHCKVNCNHEVRGSNPRVSIAFCIFSFWCSSIGVAFFGC